MKAKAYILSLILASTSFTAWSQTFYDVVDSIAASNPTLKAAKASADAEVSRVKAENMLEDPEVEFSRKWRSGEGENRWGAGIKQGFDWFGAYGARKNLAASMTAANDLKLAGELNKLHTDIGKSLIEVIAADKKIEILEGIAKGMKELENKYSIAWDHGEATILDLNKIKIEAIRATSQLQDARNERQALLADLQGIAGNPTLSVNVPVDFPITQLKTLAEYDALIADAPEVKAAESGFAVAEQELKVAKMNRLPGFSIGYDHDFEDGAHFNGFSLGVTIPVYSRKHSMEAVAADNLAARFEAISVQSQLESKVKSLHANAAALQEMMRQYSPLVEGVNNLTLLKKALDGGQINLLEYLQEVNYFLTARLDLLELTKSYHLALQELNALNYRAL